MNLAWLSARWHPFRRLPGPRWALPFKIVASGSTERVARWQFAMRGEVSFVAWRHRSDGRYAMPTGSLYCVGPGSHWCHYGQPALSLSLGGKPRLTRWCFAIPVSNQGLVYFINPMRSHLSSLQDPATPPKYSGTQATFTLLVPFSYILSLAILSSNLGFASTLQDVLTVLVYPSTSTVLLERPIAGAKGANPSHRQSIPVCPRRSLQNA